MGAGGGKSSGLVGIHEPETGDVAQISTKTNGKKGIETIAENVFNTDSAPLPFSLAVQLGLVTGFEGFSVVGFNQKVATSSYETVWENSDLYVFPTTAVAMDIVSDDANDTNTAGTGARKVTIIGLDSNYDPLEEIVNLNGTTAVTTTELFFRINKMVITDAGSSTFNEGKISASNGGTDYSIILENRVNSRAGIFTIKAGFSAFITGALIGGERNKEFMLRVETINNSIKTISREIPASQGLFQVFLDPPTRLLEKTDIMFNAKAVTSGILVEVTTAGFLVAN